jgi:hypothetical protein
MIALTVRRRVYLNEWYKFGACFVLSMVGDFDNANMYVLWVVLK